MKTSERKEFHRLNPGQFQRGNQAAAKPKWTDAEITKFQSELRALREGWHLTYGQMARALGYSSVYVKQMEGFYSQHRQQPSAAFVRQVEELRALPPTRNRPTSGLARVYAAFNLPPYDIEILSKPRRCLGCRKWFIPVTPNQKIHNAASCQRAARKNKRKVKSKR